jgi:hypothetical protein
MDVMIDGRAHQVDGMTCGRSRMAVMQEFGSVAGVADGAGRP